MDGTAGLAGFGTQRKKKGPTGPSRDQHVASNRSTHVASHQQFPFMDWTIGRLLDFSELFVRLFEVQ